MSPTASNRRTAGFRWLSLFLAVFIFAVTAFVELTHDADEFEWVSYAHACFTPGNAGPTEGRHVCLACLLINAFQSAQVIWFFLLLLVLTVSDCRQSYSSKLHSSCFFAGCRVRGPPLFSTDFSFF